MTCKLQTKGHKFHDNSAFKFHVCAKPHAIADIGLHATNSSSTALTALCRQNTAITGHATSSKDSDFCSERNTFESRTEYWLFRLKFSVFSSFPTGTVWYKR